MSSSADRKLALIHQTKLFPPLADYLDAMELCLMTVVKISKPKINSWDLKTASKIYFKQQTRTERYSKLFKALSRALLQNISVSGI